MKHLYIILITVVLGSSISCKDFLDVEPTESGDSETSLQTPADAKVRMTGIMSKMAEGDYYGRNLPLYGEAKGGDLTVFSKGRGYDYLYEYNHSESSNTYSGIWSQGYNILTQINNLLENIERLESEESADDFSLYKGQALTARAIVYFDLVRLYGKSYNEDKSTYGVPNITKTLLADAQELRATVEENYQQIITDLTTAEPLLPEEKNDGNISYYANKAMQARVYLYMEEYDKALSAAEEIINSGKYTLYANNEWVGSWEKDFGNESIFELAILPSEGDLGTSSLGAYFRRNQHGGGSFLGNFLASDNFLSLLNEDPDDIRFGVMDYDETSSTRMGSCYKYSGSVERVNKDEDNSTAMNIKVIRLSEIYLIAAEAALYENKEKAATYLNEIRKRSPNLASATETNVDLDMIADERSKELFGEGHRFFDMIRWDKSITFNDELGNLNVTHRDKTIDRTFYKTLLPISINEILANPKIKDQQNPGY
ncbi:MAG TPA: RagB/SusD family nutrient uptake outer membrane protein [Sphingobacterium sp.]|nr:RagB/SusD family nutrient uptake outer membrane protein [Sphingobacterium sp.]